MVMAPVTLALASAISWGAADFTGGVASRRTNAYNVVVGGELIGLLVVIGLAVYSGEKVPPVQSWLLAGLAGLCGGYGLVLLYRALASGQMSIAAPISAVLAAAIPVLVSAVTQGWPGLLTFAGLVLALAAIWLISRGEEPGISRRMRLEQLRPPFMAGIVFGLFFVLVHQASQESVLWPIIATRLASLALLIPVGLFTRQLKLPGRSHWSLIALSGLLDVGGNSLFILAGQLGRMDVAAVLSSLYPAATVALAWLLLKERVTRLQMVGILSAFVAIWLISF
jgi:uncharacterized membrane protein